MALEQELPRIVRMSFLITEMQHLKDRDKAIGRRPQIEGLKVVLLLTPTKRALGQVHVILEHSR